MEDVNDLSIQADQLRPLAVSVVSALREVGANNTVTVMLVERLAVLAVQQQPAPGSIDQNSRSATRNPWASPSRGVRMRNVHDFTGWTACMYSGMRARSADGPVPHKRASPHDLPPTSNLRMGHPTCV